jgi:hypothetical protein
MAKLVQDIALQTAIAERPGDFQSRLQLDPCLVDLAVLRMGPAEAVQRRAFAFAIAGVAGPRDRRLEPLARLADAAAGLQRLAGDAFDARRRPRPERRARRDGLREFDADVERSAQAQRRPGAFERAGRGLGIADRGGASARRDQVVELDAGVEDRPLLAELREVSAVPPLGRRTASAPLPGSGPRCAGARPRTP